MSQKIGGIKKIKTAQKSKLRSKPRVEGQEYLELYLMTKERNRLKRYHEVIDDTRLTTEEEIEELEKEYAKLERKAGIAEPDSHPDIKAAGTDSPKHKKRKPVKPMKTVVMDY
ncbi:MAG: hypothetical protein KAU60_17485 [Desulfobacterales bacterium]|nr:hypothetical protein [Desulfobacterales bacterium]